MEALAPARAAWRMVRNVSLSWLGGAGLGFQSSMWFQQCRVVDVDEKQGWVERALRAGGRKRRLLLDAFYQGQSREED